MRMIFHYLKPYYLRMFFGLIIKMLGTFMDLGLPWVLAYIIDNIIPLQNVSLILWWGVVMVALSVGARSFNIIANRMAAWVARNTTRTLRHDLFEKILSLSGAQLDYFTIPSLEARMTSDTYNIHSMIGMMQRIGVRAPIILIGGIIITSTLEPVLTLVLVGVLPFLAFIVIFVSKKGIPLYIRLQQSVDKMVRVVRENITGIRVIKALSKSSYEKKRFFDVNTELMNKELKAGTTMAITNPAMNLMLNIGLTLVVIVGAYRVNLGASQPGKIVAFLSYFAIMLQAVMAITRIFVVYSKASASAARIAQVLNAPEDLKTIENTKLIRPEYHIAFNHVSFSYSKEPNIVDVDFAIKKGGSLGIIGSTGSGKTTLVNLLMRFYDVDEGSITIDGRDIRSFDKQQLRKKFGVVFQNDVLFADRIYENISFGRDLPYERVHKAAADAQAASFINELEAGLDFSLAIKGNNLSGGQKQRLLIARALAGKPEILILDDSSRALDYRTDALLRKAIRENYQDTTMIVIAQRISSVMKLDHILVLEDGKVAGYGSHEELLAACSVYQEIYQSQMMS
ncbi:MAG: ABC transporter ATP-binding protein [Clostridiales bacterium]|nr:ABC transporter ATP-binding protein [Clostridiales bacterium]